MISGRSMNRFTVKKKGIDSPFVVLRKLGIVAGQYGREWNCVTTYSERISHISLRPPEWAHYFLTEAEFSPKRLFKLKH
jgi:hypothetical protein